MQTTGEAFRGAFQSINQSVGMIADTVDQARKLEGDAIFNEAQLTMRQRQNKLIEEIKADPTLYPDQWEQAYLEKKDTIHEGYETIDNKYAGPAIKNFLTGQVENARANFDSAKTAYMKADSIALNSNTLERQIQARDSKGAWFTIAQMAPLLSPAEREALISETQNSLFHGMAIDKARAAIESDDLAGAKAAVEEEYTLEGMPGRTMSAGTRSKLRSEVDELWTKYTKAKDERLALVAQDELDDAWQNGKPNLDKLTSYMDSISKKGFYDADTENTWWARGKMLQENALSGSGSAKQDAWSMNAALLRSRCANKEFTNAKEYNQIVHTMLLDGSIDPTKIDAIFNYFDAPNTPLTTSITAFKDKYYTPDGKGKTLLPKATAGAVLMFVEAYALKNNGATADELGKIAEAAANPALIKAIGEKATTGGIKLTIESDPEKSGSFESALYLLTSGAWQAAKDGGFMDTLNTSLGTSKEFTVKKAKDAVIEAGKTAVQKDLETLANLAPVAFNSFSGKIDFNKQWATPIGTSGQWDDNLNAPVFTVQKKDKNGQVFSENYTIRIMTQEYLDEHWKEITTQSNLFKQKYPRKGEEYLSLIEEESPMGYREVNGVMVKTKIPGKMVERYYSLLGATGRK